MEFTSQFTYSHAGILHCVAQVRTISNLLYKRFLSLSTLSSSFLVRSIFLSSSQLVYDITMFMVISTSEYFLTMILIVTSTIRNFHCFYGLYSPCEDVIRSLSCAYCVVLILFIYTYFVMLTQCIIIITKSSKKENNRYCIKRYKIRITRYIMMHLVCSYLMKRVTYTLCSTWCIMICDLVLLCISFFTCHNYIPSLFPLPHMSWAHYRQSKRVTQGHNTYDVHISCDCPKNSNYISQLLPYSLLLHEHNT